MSGVRHSRRAIAAAIRMCTLGAALIAAGCDLPSSSSKPDNGLVLRTRMPAALEAAGPGVAAQLVPFERVRLTLTRITGTKAADVTFPVDAGQDPIQLSVDVPLGLSVPLFGELFTLVITCIDADGTTVYRGGPVPVLIKPGSATPPVDIQLVYVGDGAVASVLQIVPSALSVILGQAFSFTATVLDDQGNPIDAPVVWSILDPLLATLTSPLGGAGNALGLLGTARIVAAVPDGPADTALLTIAPLPTVTRLLELVSGGGQSGLIGLLLGDPIVVRVVNDAAQPLSGIPVSFTASNGGLLGTPNVQSGSTGLAQTTWTLGSLLGTQTLTATADGLTGPPLTVPATGLPLVQSVATALEMTTSVATTVAGQLLSTAFTVRAVDAAGNVVTSYANPIVVALGNNPGGATLLGTRTVTPTNGVATFDDLSIQKAASGYSLVATSQGLSSSTSNSFSVTNAAAAIMSIAGGNNQSAILGALLGNPLSVRVTDAFANPVAGVPVDWAVTIGAGLLGNPVTQTNASGIATNTWTLGLLAGLQRVTASANGLSGSPAVFSATGLLSPPITRLLELVSGGQQSGIIGTLLGQPIVVRVVDDAARPVSGVPISFAASNGGVLGTPNAVSSSTGLAQSTWTLGSLLGTQTMTATAQGLTGQPLTVPATGLPIAQPVATALEIVTSLSSMVAGTTLSSNLVVRAVDEAGDVVTNYANAITVALGNNPGGAALLGTRTVTPTNGVATFDDLSLEKAASGYTLVASAQGLTGATSNAFGVTNAAAAILASVSGNNQSALIGALLGNPLSVRVTDAFQNPVAGTPVAWAATLGGGVLGSASTQTNSSGIASNTWTLGSLVGLQRASASVNGLTGSPALFDATALPIAQPVATALQIVTSLSSMVAGTGLSSDLVVRAVDAAGNVVTNYTNPITVTLGANPGGATLLGTRTITPVNGVATFDDLSLQKAASGYTLVTTASGLTSATSNAFSVTNAAAAILASVSGNNQSALVGALLGNPLSVRVTDAFANPVAGVPVAWSPVLGGGSLGNSTTQTNTSGVATNTWTLGSLVGLQRASASVSGLAGSPSFFDATGLPLPQPVATALEMTTSVSSIVAGTALSGLVIRAVDEAGNVVPNYANPITVALGNNPGSATLLGTRTVTPTNGVATFDDLSLQKAASGYTIVATASGLTGATSNAFNVTNAAASILAIVSGNNQSAVLGALLGNPLSVRVTDAFANPVAGVPVDWAVTIGAGLLGNPVTQTNASGIATNTWTLGLLAGLQRVTASANGLSGSPAVFSATGLLGLERGVGR